MSRVREMAADGFVCVMHIVTRRCLYVGSSDHNAIGYLSGSVLLGFGADGEAAKNNARWECARREWAAKQCPGALVDVQSDPCRVNLAGRFARMVGSCDVAVGHTTGGARVVALPFEQRGIMFPVFASGLEQIERVYRSRGRKWDGASPGSLLVQVRLSPLSSDVSVSFPATLARFSKVLMGVPSSQDGGWNVVFRTFLD